MRATASGNDRLHGRSRWGFFAGGGWFSRAGRTLLGLAFVFGGFLSFLPVLGIWMLPLGLVILSVDWAFVRRWRRQAEVRVTRWWKARQAARA